MPASLDGQPIFGTAVRMTTPINPVAMQVSPRPGLNGMPSIPLGQRGAVTMVAGLLSGVNPADYANAESLFFNFYDGLPHVLIDTLGRTWNNVVLESFEPDQGRIRQSPGGVYFREYKAKFNHLTTS